MRAPHNSESVSNVLNRMRHAVGMVEGILVLMDEYKIEGPLMIQGQKELLRGLTSVEKWAADGAQQVKLELENSGAFNAGGAEIAQKPGRVVKKPAKKKKKVSKKKT